MRPKLRLLPVPNLSGRCEYPCLSITTRGTAAGTVEVATLATTKRPLAAIAAPQRTRHVPAPRGAVRGTSSDHEIRRLRDRLGTPFCVVPSEYVTSALQRAERPV